MVVPGLGAPGNDGRLRADRGGPRARPQAPSRESSRTSTSATAAARSGSRGITRGPTGPGSTSPRSPVARGRRRLEVVLEIQRTGGAGDQLRDERGRRSRGDAAPVRRHGVRRLDAHRRPRRARPTREPTAPFLARSAMPWTRRSSRSKQAIRSCTGLPAEILGLPDRGVLRAGAAADVVVFDPGNVSRCSNFRPADPVCSWTEASLRQRQTADRRRRSPRGCEDKSQASRPQHCGCKQRWPGLVDRPGETHLDG